MPNTLAVLWAIQVLSIHDVRDGNYGIRCVCFARKSCDRGKRARQNAPKREWMNSISFLFILMDFYYEFEYHHIFSSSLSLCSLYRCTWIYIYFFHSYFGINYYAGRGTQIVYENALSNVHIVCRWRQQQQQPIANKWCVSTRCRLSTHVAHTQLDENLNGLSLCCAHGAFRKKIVYSAPSPDPGNIV